MPSTDAASYRFALDCMAQLAGSGVTTVVASPGFRNSPLLLAAHRTHGLEVVTAVDERGAAFFALGVSRAQRRPVAVLCTSGTAVGNYLPAAMEANHSQVPLVFLTADRPQELVGTGANQVTDQAKIFGTHVRLFGDTAPPTGAAHEGDHAGYLVGKAVSRALQPMPGPVQLNIRFREPFLPNADDCARLEAQEKPRPWSFLGSATGPSEEQALAIGSMMRAAKRPLFVLGPGGYGQKLLGRLNELCARTGIPVLAEAASGLAFVENTGRPRLLHRAESALQAMEKGELPAPDLFVRIGAPLTGRAYSRLLASTKLPQLVFEETGETREPGFHPSVMVEGNIEAWLGTQAAWEEAKAEPAWAETLTAFDAKVEAKIDEHLASSTSAFTEWHFHRAFENRIGRGVNLFLGNSMPIRDFNAVFPRTAKRLRTFSNRGLSGIDGLIASAAGVALGSNRETHAVLGDLSTLHDLPSLALLSGLRQRINCTLWVMNNGGGEIFRIVGTSKSGGQAEWFTTPQEYDLAALAKSFRISFSRVHDLASLEAITPEAFSENGVRIIEVLCTSEENLKVRKSFPYAH
jgi:2-succinyl-5-enolpyruvyl-6-hydroxy-3-cyclohexene-1-carboxylate synthase